MSSKRKWKIDKQLEVQGTVKAAMLRGDKDWPSLVASSVYDTKPVHFLIMVGQQLKWIVKEKPIFNVDTGRVESKRFLKNEHNKLLQ